MGRRELQGFERHLDVDVHGNRSARVVERRVGDRCLGAGYELQCGLPPGVQIVCDLALVHRELSGDGPARSVRWMT